MDLCEGRLVYARDAGFMRSGGGFMRIYVWGAGFIRAYADLCNGRWVHTDLCGVMQGAWIYTKDVGFSGFM